MRDNPTEAELIRRALASRLADVHVSMPGIVVSYDATTKTATIQPAIKRVLFDDADDRVVETIPPIPNVPVEFPGAGSLTLHFTLAAGDTGRLNFCTNSIAEWRQTGKVSEPASLKLHDLGSCTFTPGLRHRSNVNPDTDESIGKPGGLRLSFTETAIKAGLGAEAVALASLVEARISAIETWAAAHTHSGVTTGPGASGPAVPVLSPGSPVAASNLKADP